MPKIEKIHETKTSGRKVRKRESGNNINVTPEQLGKFKNGEVNIMLYRIGKNFLLADAQKMWQKISQDTIKNGKEEIYLNKDFEITNLMLKRISLREECELSKEDKKDKEIAQLLREKYQLSDNVIVQLLEGVGNSVKRGETVETGEKQKESKIAEKETEYDSITKDSADIEKNFKEGKINETTKEQLIKARVGQGIFRDNVVKLYEGVCCVTGCKIKNILIASHIQPWRASNNKERLDCYNGLLLRSDIDKLFDQGYITFTEDGKIRRAKELDKDEANKLGIRNGVHIHLHEKSCDYMQHHRENIFKK